MTQKLRIGFVATCLNTGGAETALLRLVTRMNGERFEPHVHSLRPLGEIAERMIAAGIPVESSNISGAAQLLRGRRLLAEWISRVKPDLIQGWMYHGNIAASLLANEAPVCWSIHSSPGLHGHPSLSTSAARQICRRWSRTRTRAIVYCSRASQLAHEALGFDDTHSVYIPNGFELVDSSALSSLRVSARKRWSLTRDDFVVGMIARFHPCKGHRDFVKAIKGVPNAKVVMCGKNVTRENLELAGWISEAGLSERCILLGEQSDMSSVYPALDLLVSASHSEAFPLVLGEAGSFGVPSIATDVGDSREVLGDSQLIVEAGKPDQLCRAIQKFERLDSSEREQIVNTFRSRILDRFTLDQHVEQYEQLFLQTAQRMAVAA